MTIFTKFYRMTLAAIAITMSITSVSASPELKNQNSYSHSQTGISLIGAEIPLPSEGSWKLDSIDNTSLSDVSLIVPEVISQRNLGSRQLKKKEREEQNKQRYLINRVNSELDRFARKNEGKLPDTLDEIKGFERLKDKDLSNLFMIPNSTIMIKKDTNWKRIKDKKPYLLELNPVFNNNKHWVVFTNGRVQLVDIDHVLLNKYGLETKHQKESISEQLKSLSDVIDYQLIARLKKDVNVKSASLRFKNIESGKILEKQWSIENNQSQDPELLEYWATQRLSHWNEMLKNGQEGYLPYWFEAGLRQYDIARDDVSPPTGFRRAVRRDNNRSTSLFSVLGGRSAIQETLQLQQLQQLDTEENRSNPQNIPIDTIEGVTVKSHPFKEMLAGSEGGSLALANSVPADRFFAWFAKPKDLTKYLNGGSDFIFNSGSALLGKSNNSFLEERYLKKLGVDARWVQRFFEHGAVNELAVVLPDLFLLDGTDLSIVMQLKQADVVKGLLSLIGIDASSQIFTFKHAHGESYWTLQNDLLVVSTNLDEINNINVLITGDKKQSLGQSAEFKYMLTQLPVEQKTHSFFYFSDPFIRHLVSPQVKLAQLRRIQARAEMESFAAAALLYKANDNLDQPSLDLLIKNKYMYAPGIVDDMMLSQDGSVASTTWGTPADMPSLLDRPVNMIRESEKKAYKFYLDNYNRFWRRFFDPIAIRLNQETDKQMEVSTFILPLINNSIYEELRAMVVSDDKDAKPLNIPILDPKPVAQLSLNLNKALWKENADEFAHEFLEQVVGIPARVVDYIGPDIHLALADSDPILVMGTGGLAGSLGMSKRRGGMSLMLPLAGSMFTRPSALMISLTDAEAVKSILRDVSDSTRRTPRDRSFAASELYGVAGKDSWMYSLNIEGIIGMRFGIEIQDNYLIITNQPMSFNPKIASYDKALNNGAALTLSPKSAIKQRPALHASANEQRLKAALSGINVLYPYMVSGTDTIKNAKSKVKAEFGYEPKHSGKGKWLWQNNQMMSTLFGNAKRKLLAEYDADDEFGILRDVEDVNINMQFEDDGLRARVLWNLAE